MLKKVSVLGLVVVGVILMASLAQAVVSQPADGDVIVKVGENVQVLAGGTVKSAVAVGGSVTIAGKVIDDVVAVGGSVTLGDTAQVGGDVVAIGGKVNKSVNAKIGGEVVEVSTPKIFGTAGNISCNGWQQTLAVISALSLIGFAALVMLMVAVFTPQLGTISAALEKRFWKSFWFGLLAAVLFIPISLVLVFSLVGIVLIPVWIVVFAAAGLFGYIAASQLVGKKVLQALRVRNKPMMVEALLGVLIITLVALAPIVGGLVKVVLCSAGLGATALTKFGMNKG